MANKTTSKGTPATVALAQAKVPFDVHAYDHDPSAQSYGTEAAEAMGVPAERVFKTLVARGDKNGFVVRGSWLVVGDCVLVVTKLHRQLRTTNYQLPTTNH